MVTVFVALGANLQQPQQQIMQAAQALATLAEGDSYKLSPCYRSVPMGDVEQPDYVNAVACFDTSLPPLELLDALQAIENNQGRVRILHWGPRTLDLDLLLYGQQHIELPRLTVPHYGMKLRSFVLVPLFDIAPQLILPCGTALTDLVTQSLRDELQLLSPQ